jgi:DNA replication licensing factor MCM2
MKNHGREIFDELLAVDQNQHIILQNATDLVLAYLQMNEIRREIAHNFQHFFVHFKDESEKRIYVDKINSMISMNRTAIEFSFPHLSKHCAIIAIWLGNYPSLVLDILDETTYAVVTNDVFSPFYHRISNEVHVRITDRPVIDQMSTMRQAHLNVIVRTEGVVTRRTDAVTQLSFVTRVCGKCEQKTAPIASTGEKPISPTFCASCSSRWRYSNRFFPNSLQKLTIHEPPSSVPP